MDSSIIWWGVVPALAYVIIDSFAKRRTALWAALFFGLAEFIYSITVAGLDYLSLIMGILLIGFVILSLYSNTDLYFKIAGPINNAIMAVVLLFTEYVLHRSFFYDSVTKYLGWEKIHAMAPQYPIELMQEYIRVLGLHLPFWLLGQGALTLIAAFYWGKWWWFAFRVPGFYLALFLCAQSVAQVVIAPYIR